MNLLADRIEKLLMKNDCVVIRSFGGFIKNSKSAVIDSDKIIHPGYEISFNSMLMHDDGLLLGLITEEENISYKEATKLLDKDIKNLKKEILDKKYLSFGNIGEFTYSNNILSFNPFYADYLPENFGLTDLAIREKSVARQLSENVVLEGEKLIIDISELRRRTVKYAALVAVIALITLFVPETSSNQYAGFLMSQKNVIMENDKIVKSDKALFEFNQSIIKSQVKEQLIVDSEEVELYDEKKENANYHIVVASFNSLQQVEEYKLEKDYNNLTVLKSNGTPVKYRCVVASFSTQQAAIDFQKKNMSNISSWVLYQR